MIPLVPLVAFPLLVRDYSGPYGPDHRPFWIATHLDGRRELVNKEPKRHDFRLLGLMWSMPVVQFPKHSLILDVSP